MAKLECLLRGDFHRIISHICQEIVGGSLSATMEDQSDFSTADARCAVRVFERYSWFGGNRVSLAVTVFEAGGSIRLSAITSGGSQAMFFKINTVGEEAFLEKLEAAVSPYRIY